MRSRIQNLVVMGVAARVSPSAWHDHAYYQALDLHPHVDAVSARYGAAEAAMFAASESRSSVRREARALYHTLDDDGEMDSSWFNKKLILLKMLIFIENVERGDVDTMTHVVFELHGRCEIGENTACVTYKGATHLALGRASSVVEADRPVYGAHRRHHFHCVCDNPRHHSHIFKNMISLGKSLCLLLVE